MHAHELPQVTEPALAPFPVHWESQAPWPHCSFAVWQVDSAPHTRLHGAVVGHAMAAPWHADVWVHWISHAEPLGHWSVAAWHDERPPHSIVHRMPSGQATVTPWQAEAVLQSMTQRSFVQPPVQATGHITGVEEVPVGHEPPTTTPPSSTPPSRPQIGPHAPCVQGKPAAQT